jgi:hypothetical protein
VVDHKPHVRLVDAHAKGDRRHHHLPNLVSCHPITGSSVPVVHCCSSSCARVLSPLYLDLEPMRPPRPSVLKRSWRCRECACWCSQWEHSVTCMITRCADAAFHKARSNLFRFLPGE